jgi:hypothetical protein
VWGRTAGGEVEKWRGQVKKTEMNKRKDENKRTKIGRRNR